MIKKNKIAMVEHWRVWISKDRMYNKELVEKGLAREKYFSPNGKYRNVFIEAQNKAKQQKLNIWSK